MPLESGQLDGVTLLTPNRMQDGRGWFSETYNKARWREAGVLDDFVQDNQSWSRDRGTVRGLHFQSPPSAQAKLVSVLAGSILDVTVDIRRASSGYGKWASHVLTAAGGEQLYIPVGFAHGFCTLEPDTHILYKVANYYDRASEGGLLWCDDDLAIPWPVAPANAIVSDKDRVLPRLSAFVSPF